MNIQINHNAQKQNLPNEIKREFTLAIMLEADMLDGQQDGIINRSLFTNVINHVDRRSNPDAHSSPHFLDLSKPGDGIIYFRDIQAEIKDQDEIMQQTPGQIANNHRNFAQSIAQSTRSPNLSITETEVWDTATAIEKEGFYTFID